MLYTIKDKIETQMDPIDCLCVFEKILLLTISVSLPLKKHKNKVYLPIAHTYWSKLKSLCQNSAHSQPNEVCVPNCQSFYFSLLCESKKRHSMKTFSKIHLFSPTPHANMLFSELLEKLFLFFFFYVSVLWVTTWFGFGGLSEFWRWTVWSRCT